MNHHNPAATRRVVIIDDSECDAEALTRAMKPYGVTDIRWFDEPPALETLDLDGECLVVLDLILRNEVDGLKVLERMAALGLTETPIFLVSGQMSDLLQVAESYGRAHGLTIIGSVEKPLCPKDVAKVLALG